MAEPGTAVPRSGNMIVAIAVMTSATMEVLDTSVVNVSLPHISGSLSSTVDEATWVLTSYLVANAIILPITGWLSNYFGRKRLLLTVVTGFTLSSVLCGLAPSLPLLVFFRVLQGLTGGGSSRCPRRCCWRSSRPASGARPWPSGAWASSPRRCWDRPWAAGSPDFSWRWVFLINLPVGILSLVMISMYIDDPPYIRRGAMRFDVWGMGLLVVGMGALQIMLDKGQEEDWFNSRFIPVLAVTAVAGLTAFVVRELRAPPSPWSSWRYGGSGRSPPARHRTVLGFVLYGSLVMLPLFMQELLGWNAQTAGLWTSPRGLATAACMPLVGYLLGRDWDPRWMLAFGMTITSLAFFGYAHEPGFRHLEHPRPPDQPGRRPGVPVRSPDPAHHGPGQQGGHPLRHQPVQRHAQHRLEHGGLLRHHADRPGDPRSTRSRWPAACRSSVPPSG